MDHTIVELGIHHSPLSNFFNLQLKNYEKLGLNGNFYMNIIFCIYWLIYKLRFINKRILHNMVDQLSLDINV